MRFTNFYLRILFRLLLITAVLLVFVYCLLETHYLRSLYAGVLASVLIAELMTFIYRFVRHLNQFLLSLQHQDFSLNFKEGKGNLREFYQSMNKIIALFSKISVQKEINHRYLETLVEHVRIGIISFDKGGNVHLINKAFLELIGKTSIREVKQLRGVSESLTDEISNLRPGETKVIRFQKENELFNLSLHATSFRLDEESFTLISMQNITHELNAKEMEAWQSLIKVLTHEIMNSVSPIISLSGSLKSMVSAHSSPSEVTYASWQNLGEGLRAIQERSLGLQHFTEKYRELTFLSSPKFEEVNLQHFFEPIVVLLKPEMDKKHIRFYQVTEPLMVTFDPKLMEQALINLIRNAIDACEHKADPVITLRARGLEKHYAISIHDNGSGIETSLLDKVFIPFFTTKKQGSGIGLALTRQIVLLHKGEIQVQSNPEEGSVFTITLL